MAELPEKRKRKEDGENSEQSLEGLTKTISEVYWMVTADVREGASKMEDTIETGKNDKVLECKQENMATLWSWLMQSVKFYNDVLASFFRDCPLISTICPEDQKLLSAHSYLAVWMIWNAPLFKNGDSYIPFLNGYRYNRAWMESILPADFVSYLHGYAEKQNSARFSINELALLACMALTPKGVAGIKEPEAISKIHERFQAAMELEVSKTRVNPKEILKEVPILLQQLEEAVARQELILKLQQQEQHPVRERERLLL
ncbi:uncharacterized protein [Watersipora subatra]|uniref:uncharacterized protein n=1 Tax=Watersipora subatra TaxID=2589382 RepID=UPI00355B9EFD